MPLLPENLEDDVRGSLLGRMLRWYTPEGVAGQENRVDWIKEYKTENGITKIEAEVPAHVLELWLYANGRALLDSAIDLREAESALRLPEEIDRDLEAIVTGEG